MQNTTQQNTDRRIDQHQHEHTHPPQLGLRSRLQNDQGPLGWIYRNLFSTPLNVILTLVGGWAIYKVAHIIISWALVNATWIGDSGQACDRAGACWVFVRENFLFIMVGFYPHEQAWRPAIVGAIALALIIPLFIRAIPVKHRMIIGAATLFVFPFFSYAIIHGSIFGIGLIDPIITTEKWGGLMLTLILASVGMVAALPLGILLALGRRADNMPLVKVTCIIFIEFWRGVPLITVLFMASVMLPLFFPQGTDFDKLARALIGLTLFQSAYMAEVIRGGLQAIDKGQYEAADAMALTYWKKMGLIILPQALKLVIPGIVNTLIGLFKDTTLVYVIGMWDLLHATYSATRNPEWLQFAIEAFVFASFVYWIFCFGMSRYSQALEKRLAASNKR